MTFFDFDFWPYFRHPPTVSQPGLEAADEPWPNGFLAALGVRSHLPVSDLRRSLPGQSLRQRIFLSGSVPLLGVCSIHLSRKLARHRSLSPRPAVQALSYGLPGTGFSQHLGPRQRGARLAHLPRLCPSADPRRPRSLPRRAFRSGVVGDRLCLRLDHHRFVSVAVSLGSVSPPQECRQTAYAFGRAGQHSDQCLCDWRPDPRRQPAGPTVFRSRGVLFARPRLRGLRSPLHLHSGVRLLRYARQEEYAVLPPLPAPDQTILLTGVRTAQRYPDPLRRIHYFDAEKNSRLIFLSSNFLLPPLTIAQLYRARWQVELFFRWIKQHLHIKAFYGTSENAVKTQVWVALSVYALVAIAKKRLGLDLSLYKILQISSVTIFEKTPILEGFSNFGDGSLDAEPCIQLSLFDF